MQGFSDLFQSGIYKIYADPYYQCLSRIVKNAKIEMPNKYLYFLFAIFA